MSELDVDKVVQATQTVLKTQSKDALYELTPRTTRALVEQELGLEPGTLDEPQYKIAVKDAAQAFISEVNARPNDVSSKKDASVKKSGPSKSKPAKSESADKATSSSKDGKKRKRSSKIVESDADNDEDVPPPSEKKAKAGKKTVADAESDVPNPPPKKKAKATEKATPTEKAYGQFLDLIGAEMKRDMAQDVASDDEARIQSTSKPMPITEFDSDLSSVIDESPVKKGRKKKKESSSDTKDSRPSNGKREKKAHIELDKDEEEIKRLKGFVVACGVRKVWSKEFKDKDKPSQQIAHLKKMLADLGMTGRLSMDKAKSIRAKRELQQELQDVVEFDRKRGSGARRGSEAKQKQSASESEHEEDAEVPKPARNRLHNSIAAFLADQSDDE